MADQKNETASQTLSEEQADQVSGGIHALQRNTAGSKVDSIYVCDHPDIDQAPKGVNVATDPQGLISFLNGGNTPKQ